jgi:hypothetical protein
MSEMHKRRNRTEITLDFNFSGLHFSSHADTQLLAKNTTSNRVYTTMSSGKINLSQTGNKVKQSKNRIA